MTGSEAQIEWAERIRESVGREFDRVHAAFSVVAAKQRGEKRAETEAILRHLEKERAAAMNHTEAGYFIVHWQEISDQVRKMLINDREVWRNAGG